ncbi:MAG: DsbE family thiol:disulfide interchange protein [Rhizobiaceae bacterium]
MAQALETRAGSGRRLVLLVPLVLFLILAGVFLYRLATGGDISRIPSALIGEPAPATMLSPLDGTGLPGLDSTIFAGKVTLVNVFASWCAPCRDEHPMLMALAQDERFSIWGMNYKDNPANALTFLTGLGNPYRAIGADTNGRAGIDWGVYGVPETFVVGKDGAILYKHVGPLTPEAVVATLMPEIEKALASSP